MAKPDEQVSWNLSQEISRQIASMINTSRRMMLNGKVLDAFFVVSEIRLLIEHHFNKDQTEKVKQMESKINKISLRMIKPSDEEEEDDDEFEYTSKKSKINKRLFKTLLNKRYLLVQYYRVYIIYLLDEYGYLMERKSDASTMF